MHIARVIQAVHTKHIVSFPFLKLYLQLQDPLFPVQEAYLQDSSLQLVLQVSYEISNMMFAGVVTSSNLPSLTQKAKNLRATVIGITDCNHSKEQFQQFMDQVAFQPKIKNNQVIRERVEKVRQPIQNKISKMDIEVTDCCQKQNKMIEEDKQVMSKIVKSKGLMDLLDQQSNQAPTKKNLKVKAKPKTKVQSNGNGSLFAFVTKK